MKEKNIQEWILLVHLLPQKPTKLRVHVWRRLQTLGAIPIKNSVYVLPYNDKTNEDFQWLRQEIESFGGEANLFRAGLIEGATDKDIIQLFRSERDKDYAKLARGFDRLRAAVDEQGKGNSISIGRLSRFHAEASRLRQELDRIASIDFFDAAEGRKAREAFEKCRRDLQAKETRNSGMRTRKNDPATLDVAEYQNRRWVTRKDPHIDRLASSWLIRRFIDQRPRLYFVSEDQLVENGLTFDMRDGTFTHRGEDCTFETMIKDFGLEADGALRELAEIVHDIDLKDSKFNRPEATGFNAVIRGLAAVYRDDGERVKQCLPVFDAMYKLFSNGPDKPKAKRSTGRKKR